jgi:hypothetical protein
VPVSELLRTFRSSLLSHFLRFKSDGYFGILHHKMDAEGSTVTPVTADEPGYNDISLCDTSPIASDVLWYIMYNN